MKYLHYFYPFALFSALITSCSEQEKVKENTKNNSDSASAETVHEPVFYGDEDIFGIPIVISTYSESAFKKLPDSDKDKICDEMEEPDCDLKTENYHLKQDSAIVYKSENRLVLKLDNGDSLVLEGSREMDSDDYIGYSYDGLMDTCSLFGVYINYYEASAYLIVNKKSGETLEVWSKPILSANCKLALVPSFDMDAGFINNGLQLVDLEEQKVKLVWEKEIRDWGPADLKWIDEDEIALRQETGIAENNTRIVRFGKLKLKQ